ncbi:MAG: C4-dicarboxylate ABC transporter [Rhodospirillaceae bacterium BRH_c57]|nr:MAG: C4-dicarboxylate ABC transporter [Rhodospirillaceae bacterium BRH_c57]
MNVLKSDALPIDRIRDFPVSFFATVMGISGLAIAFHKMEAVFTVPRYGSTVLLVLALAVFSLVVFIYAHKMLTRWEAVAEEWLHPIRISFFPTISISLILLAVAAAPSSMLASKALWWSGTALHLLMTLLVMTSWINHSRYEVVHTNPAWFIPIVGNILVPIAGVHYAPADVSWFFFAIGLVFWLVLLTIVLNRLVFHSPLPGRLVPTLAILLAPPSVGFISWGALTGGVDAFGRILYFVAVFFFLLMIPQLPKFARQPFALSWWAYSFPFAAFTIATLVMGEQSGVAFYQWTGAALFGLLILVIAGLAIRTLIAVRRGEICRPEH